MGTVEAAVAPGLGHVEKAPVIGVDGQPAERVGRAGFAVVEGRRTSGQAGRPQPGGEEVIAFSVAVSSENLTANPLRMMGHGGTVSFIILIEGSIEVESRLWRDQVGWLSPGLTPTSLSARRG